MVCVVGTQLFVVLCTVDSGAECGSYVFVLVCRHELVSQMDVGSG